MGWIVLLLGNALWIGGHLFKRVMPDQRNALGQKGRGLVAAALFISIILMVIGYRAVPYVDVWTPPSFLTHINNLLMLIAFYLMSPAPKKGKFFTWMRHPMLTGFGLWAVAHLLVNGDLASILMFGLLWVWSILSKVVINKAEPDWTPAPAGAIKWDAIGVAGSVVLLVVVGYIHAWLGVWPFG
ncbi:MAG: NnrU family protein [Pseudomonadota bacterium]